MDGFTIANHTVSHVWASEVSAEVWRAEVMDGRKRLQDHFGQPVLGFAYPFGDFGKGEKPEVLEIVREAGHLLRTHLRARHTLLSTSGPDAVRSRLPSHGGGFLDALMNGPRRCPGRRRLLFLGTQFRVHHRGRVGRLLKAKIARISADPQAQWAELPGQLGNR